MNKHHRIGKQIKGLVEEGLALKGPEVEETPAPAPAPAKGEVWVVSEGERHEGSCVRGVFAAREDALEYVRARQAYIGGDWEPLTAGAEEGELWSENDSIDYINVRKHDVR